MKLMGKLGVIVVAVALSTAGMAINKEGDPEKRAKASQKLNSAKHLLINFQGKALNFWWDIGVVEALHESKMLNNLDDLYFTGNSSGALLTAYFACWGISDETTANANILAAWMRPGDMGSNPGYRNLQVVAGMRPEVDYYAISGMVESIVKKANYVVKEDKSNGTTYKRFKTQDCVSRERPEPAHPLLIVAMNGHTLDTRMIQIYEKGIYQKRRKKQLRLYPKVRAFKSMKNKRFNKKSFRVEQKLNGRWTEIGRPCTYFASRRAAKMLESIPPSDLKCDISTIKTLDDLRMAIYASASEPTIFLPFRRSYLDRIFNDEPDLKWNILRDQAMDLAQMMSTQAMPWGVPTFGEVTLGHLSNWPAIQEHVEKNPGKIKLEREFYPGGFGMLALAEDMKRADDRIYAIGTGQKGLPPKANNFLKKWYTIDANLALNEGKQWLDMEVWTPLVERDDWLKTVAQMREMKWDAMKTARDCLSDPHSCRPFWTKRTGEEEEDEDDDDDA